MILKVLRSLSCLSLLPLTPTPELGAIISSKLQFLSKMEKKKTKRKRGEEEEE